MPSKWCRRSARGSAHSRSVWASRRIPLGHQLGVLFATKERERSIQRLLEIVRPWIPQTRAGEGRPYFMFSIGFGRAQLDLGNSIGEVQMYIGNIGSLVSSGVCYGVTRRADRAEELLFFLRREQGDGIGGRQADLVGVSRASGLALDSILLPASSPIARPSWCRTSATATASISFAASTRRQLLFFLKRMRFSEAEVSFIEQNAGRLDHMLYDVGFD